MLTDDVIDSIIENAKTMSVDELQAEFRKFGLSIKKNYIQMNTDVEWLKEKTKEDDSVVSMRVYKNL